MIFTKKLKSSMNMFINKSNYKYLIAFLIFTILFVLLFFGKNNVKEGISEQDARDHLTQQLSNAEAYQKETITSQEHYTNESKISEIENERVQETESFIESMECGTTNFTKLGSKKSNKMTKGMCETMKGLIDRNDTLINNPEGY